MKTASQSRLYLWATERASSPRSQLWIGLLFFLELILFIPLDAVLIFFCLHNRSKIFLYAGIAALASLASGLCGYLLGHFLWDLIGSFVIPHLISFHSFHKLAMQFELYENWAIFFGALIPFPLKALSLVAGVFHLSLLPFSFCLITARMLRFLFVGLAIYFFGERVKYYVERYFSQILLAVGAKVALIFFFFWMFS